MLSLLMAACTRDEPVKPAEPAMTASTPMARPSTDMAPVEKPKPPEPAWMKKLDGDMKDVIVKLGQLGGKPIETLSATEARQQPTPTDAVMAVLKEKGKDTKPEEVGKQESKDIPVAGGTIPVRITTPKGGKAPYPVIVYYHGGGFVIATNDTYDASQRALANATGAIVVSPEYRKGPESKFPTAHDDAFAAYQWAVKNAASFGGDGKKFAVAGESAGGNMATNVAIMARDKKEKLPVHMLLVYPVASSNTDSKSYQDNADAKPLNKPMMLWFVQQYTKAPTEAKDPRIDLIASARLEGLPTATVINAEIDPLLDDGVALAAKLKAAGVKVEQKTYEGVTHEFFGMGAYVDDAKSALKYGAGRVKDSLDAVK